MSRFLDLHRPGDPLLLPNPWDVGSARILQSLGYLALATTSSGFAASLGRPDMSVTREEALTHAAAIVAATELPVSADLENHLHGRENLADTLGGLVEAARELREQGTYGYLARTKIGRTVVGDAFR